MIWLCFNLLYSCCCCLMNWGVIIQSHINVEISNQSIVALIFHTFSSKYSWHIIATLRSSCPEVFCKKLVVKHFAKFIGKQLCRSQFSYKMSGRAEKRFRHMFYYNISEIFKKIFFKEHLRTADSGYEAFSSNFLHTVWNFLRNIFCWIISLFLLFVPGFRKPWRQRLHGLFSCKREH